MEALRAHEKSRWVGQMLSFQFKRVVHAQNFERQRRFDALCLKPLFEAIVVNSNYCPAPNTPPHFPTHSQATTFHKKRRANKSLGGIDLFLRFKWQHVWKGSSCRL